MLTPVVRDAYGILFTGEAHAVDVSHDEAAVRFAAGSDEGALQVDDAPSGRQIRVGDVVPLPLGQHTLEVRTSRAQVNLHRGEVALIQLHTVKVSQVLDIVPYTSTIGSNELLGIAGVTQGLAYSAEGNLETFASTRDPATGLPLVAYSDVQSIVTRTDPIPESCVRIFSGSLRRPRKCRPSHSSRGRFLTRVPTRPPRRRHKFRR